MTPELFGMLKALAGGSTLALLLMICIIFLWKDNKAKDSCKEPDKSPCKLCRVCMDTKHENTIHTLLTAQATSMSDLASAVKTQEEFHKLEVTCERTRNDLLHTKNIDLLREVLDTFKGTD